MEKKTAEEILEIIQAAGISVSSFAHCDFGAPESFEFPEPLASEYAKANDYDKTMDYDLRRSIRDKANEYWLNETGLGAWEEITQKGGMDEGSDWFSVKHFKDHDVYIKTSGWYQSHHGTEFENGYGEEVFPTQKTITVYE